jgi:hypothetical protein
MATLTINEAQRIIRERDDRAMIEHPQLWPWRPYCPVKRRDAFADNNLGFISEDNPLEVKIGLMMGTPIVVFDTIPYPSLEM